MIAHLVAGLTNLLVDIWMFPYVVAHHKKGGLDLVVVKDVEQPRRHFGNRTVIKSEKDRAPVTVHAP